MSERLGRLDGRGVGKRQRRGGGRDRREDDRVLTSDWLLPTVSPRQEVWLTGDLRDQGSFDPSAYDVALVVPDDPWLTRIQEAGFVVVDDANQGLLLRRGGEP